MVGLSSKRNQQQDFQNQQGFKKYSLAGFNKKQKQTPKKTKLASMGLAEIGLSLAKLFLEGIVRLGLLFCNSSTCF